MQADSSLPSLSWVQSVCFIWWCNWLLNNRQTWYELSYLFLRGCTYGGIFLHFSLDFNRFITRNMPLPSAGKAGARQEEKKTRAESCKCIILLHLLHLVLETHEMQQDRESGSLLTTRQRRIHSPTMAIISPHFGGLPDWEKPGSGRKHHTRGSSICSFIHLMYGIHFEFLRTLFYLKVWFLRTPTKIVGIKSAQFRLSVTS